MVFAGIPVSDQCFPGEEGTAQRSQVELGGCLEGRSWKLGGGGSYLIKDIFGGNGIFQTTSNQTVLGA